MKKIIKKILPRRIFDFVRDIVYPEKINILEERLSSLFLTQYQNLSAPNLNQKTVFKNAEFKVYSKHGGDGILAHIFSKIGTFRRTFVEIGVERGIECNTANLSLNFGWRGLLVDANKEWIKLAQDYYKDKLGILALNVKAVFCFVTIENINQLLSSEGLNGEIDLLSIDIDSNDYWVWRAINVINPRVVVMEYNSAFGLRSKTIKYDPHFHYQETYKKNPLYFGASLVALAKLARKKSYILVACDTHGHDAFFVRKDVADGKFVELSAEQAFYPNPYNIAKVGSIEKQFEQIKRLDFEEI